MQPAIARPASSSVPERRVGTESNPRGNDQWIELRPTALIQNRETLLDGNGKLRKDDYAKEIAQRDGITQGLICVLRILEPCQSFTMVSGEKHGGISIVIAMIL